MCREREGCRVCINEAGEHSVGGVGSGHLHVRFASDTQELKFKVLIRDLDSNGSQQGGLNYSQKIEG